jgi:SAM-dependent methyltransferase
MQVDEYRRMFELESHYWWFVARRRLALRLLRKWLPTNPSKPTILDLGCGTGAMLEELQTFANPVGLDMSPVALGFTRTRGMNRLVVGEGESLPFQTSSVDAIVALDVFEHIERHEDAFREAARVLRPGGVLVLSVPAFMSLWGPHDVALMHHRRYRKRQVREQLEGAGLEVCRLSYAIFMLFPVVATIRFFERRRKGEARASLPPLSPWPNRALIGLQGFEAAMIGAMSLPWGSSVVAVARKTS